MLIGMVIREPIKVITRKTLNPVEDVIFSQTKMKETNECRSNYCKERDHNILWSRLMAVIFVFQISLILLFKSLQNKL